MATTHTVTAPLVIAKNDEGGDVYVYQGAPVPEGQTDEWIERHLEGEMIAPRGAPDSIEAFLDRPAKEVIADAPDLSDEDREATIAAEKDGKNRKTVLEALADPGEGEGEGGDTPPGE